MTSVTPDDPAARLAPCVHRGRSEATAHCKASSFATLVRLAKTWTSKLVKTIVHAGAEDMVRFSHARSTKAARGMMVSQIRRQVGMEHWRGVADLILSRRAAMEAGGRRPQAASGRHGNAAGGRSGDRPRGYHAASDGRRRERYAEAAGGMAASGGGGG